MVENYMHENLKHTLRIHLAKKIKKDSHLHAITTNNGNRLSYQTKKFQNKL